MTASKQQAATANAATLNASASSWDIDPTHASAEFSVGHLGISFVTGRFRGLRGAVTLDEAHPEASHVEAEIDATSVDTNLPPRDEHLRSADFFDVAKYPAIRFVSKRVEDAASDQGTIVGQLTIRDVTREVPLRVERLGQVTDPWGNERVGVRAEATLSAKDFGLHWNAPLAAGGFLVGDKIRVTLHLEVIRRKA